MSSKLEEHGRFTLPSAAKVYRTIGPFGCDSLPKGLLREHRLKEGAWGRMRILSGEIRFVWDDDEGAKDGFIVGAQAVAIIPPTVPHHLELSATDFQLEIDFLEVVA